MSEQMEKLIEKQASDKENTVNTEAELQAKIDRIEAIKKVLYSSKYGAEIYGRVYDRYQILQQKNPNTKKCILLHVASGSTRSAKSRGEGMFDDFEGEDSILKFMEDLYNEYTDKDHTLKQAA